MAAAWQEQAALQEQVRDARDQLVEKEKQLQAAAQERSRQYQESVEALHASQREIAGDVEEALLALRGRIDEILHFAQGGGQTEATARAAAAELAGANGAPTAGWPAMASYGSPRKKPPAPTLHA